jgi:hypothetical protein
MSMPPFLTGSLTYFHYPCPPFSAWRYKKAADWTLLADLVQQNPTLPIIGNGDILTHFEAEDRCVCVSLA